MLLIITVAVHIVLIACGTGVRAQKNEFSGNVIFTLRCQADEVTYNCSFENDSAELGTTLNNLCACYNTPSSCVRILQSCLILPSNSSTTIPLPSSTCTTSIPFNSDDINFGSLIPMLVGTIASSVFLAAIVTGLVAACFVLGGIKYMKTRKKDEQREPRLRTRRAVESLYESGNFESRPGMPLVSNNVQNTYPTYEYPMAPPLRTANVHTVVNLAYGEHDRPVTYANVHGSNKKKPCVPPKTMLNKNIQST